MHSTFKDERPKPTHNLSFLCPIGKSSYGSDGLLETQIQAVLVGTRLKKKGGKEWETNCRRNWPPPAGNGKFMNQKWNMPIRTNVGLSCNRMRDATVRLFKMQ